MTQTVFDNINIARLREISEQLRDAPDYPHVEYLHNEVWQHISIRDIIALYDIAIQSLGPPVDPERRAASDDYIAHMRKRDGQ